MSDDQLWVQISLVFLTVIVIAIVLLTLLVTQARFTTAILTRMDQIDRIAQAMLRRRERDR